MDRKTAYTRTFMELLEQPIHDETVKNNYYSWWQNVRESYQARSLRLTKQGLGMLEKLDIKTYNIKFPAKVIFTPQTYLWLDEFVDCPYFGLPDAEYEDIICLRSRYTLKLLKTLDESKATGPDRIPASILKRIAKHIAVPFTILCRRLLQEGCWPKVWKLHLICPLYKRGTAFSAGNYRGVHLTPILSKLAERIIGK